MEQPDRTWSGKIKSSKLELTKPGGDGDVYVVKFGLSPSKLIHADWADAGDT